jgi:hypothetical protein
MDDLYKTPSNRIRIGQKAYDVEPDCNSSSGYPPNFMDITLSAHRWRDGYAEASRLQRAFLTGYFDDTGNLIGLVRRARSAGEIELIETLDSSEELQAFVSEWLYYYREQYMQCFHFEGLQSIEIAVEVRGEPAWLALLR